LLCQQPRIMNAAAEANPANPIPKGKTQ